MDGTGITAPTAVAPPAAFAAFIGFGCPEKAAQLGVVKKRRSLVRYFGFLRGEDVDHTRGGFFDDTRVADAIRGIAVDGFGVGLDRERWALGGFGFLFGAEREAGETASGHKCG